MAKNAKETKEQTIKHTNKSFTENKRLERWTNKES
jgi:hypothetical protein